MLEIWTILFSDMEMMRGHELRQESLVRILQYHCMRKKLSVTGFLYSQTSQSQYNELQRIKQGIVIEEGKV